MAAICRINLGRPVDSAVLVQPAVPHTVDLRRGLITFALPPGVERVTLWVSYPAATGTPCRRERRVSVKPPPWWRLGRRW